MAKCCVVLSVVGTIEKEKRREGKAETSALLESLSSLFVSPFCFMFACHSSCDSERQYPEEGVNL